ncbi:Mitochondrial metalloendopeptidase OMA1 [Neolecta irregularis DAH-3]|uniref:Mitochondrial metalloendopeptidase OMA1 n=1 Tax=Neolecta irregularis (strain DAH-3) TaxID=1198029 RepID=A0A1U7LPT3_NEOID|nr:Mitochondrial metalloendopeptidase OMA1 [Neolecta irregularis DAH-3]|eukprot:OLL24654.1 Mitochondrial metalloendopeptidase OMA1 [Neolecta irregularis DAH-3]
MTGRCRFIDMSPEEEQELSKVAYREIMTRYRNQILPGNHPTSRFVSNVAQRIIKVSGLEGLRWEIHVIDSPEKNAFILPGGKVFVFTGILPLAQNKDGLASVLAHEVGHQVARHIAEQNSFGKIIMLVRLLLTFTFGDSLGIGGLVTEFGLAMPYSRKYESEADYIGLLLMSQACFDPGEAKLFWQRMAKAETSSMPQFVSTHPTPKNRSKNIEKWLPEAYENRASSDCESHLGGIYDQFVRHTNYASY